MAMLSLCSYSPQFPPRLPIRVLLTILIASDGRIAGLQPFGPASEYLR
jgi:hypothetical protein